MASDSRDTTSWVVLELTRAGEQAAEAGTLATSLRDVLDAPSDHPVFVPLYSYVRDGHRVNMHFMEGYAFAASGLPEVHYLSLARDCPYVRQVLTAPGPNGMPVLSVLGDEVVADMRDKLRAEVASDIEQGMRVRVVRGTYAQLEGEVVGFNDGDALVHIALRSFELIRSIPRIFLEPMEV